MQECTERRMFNQTFPTSPFIYYYDDKYEIREREQRIKRKVKGMLLNSCEITFAVVPKCLPLHGLCLLWVSLVSTENVFK